MFGFNLDGTSTKLAVANRSGHGAVLYYEYSSQDWNLTKTYTGPQVGSGALETDRYGFGISLTDNLLVIGSPRFSNPAIVDIIALVDASVFDINTIVVNDRLGYNYAHNALHDAFIATSNTFNNLGMGSFSLTATPEGTVTSSDYTITHGEISAVNNSFVDNSGNFTISTTTLPTGTLTQFTQSHPVLLATTKDGVISNNKFETSSVPTGTLQLSSTHDPITATSTSFTNNNHGFISLNGRQSGTPTEFTQSHSAFTIIGTNGYQSNHTITYLPGSITIDGTTINSPFILETNHPHGKMTDFSLNFNSDNFKINKNIVVNNNNVYSLNTYTDSATTTTNLIDYWTIQFKQKPNGIPTLFSSTLSNISYGTIKHTDVVWYTDKTTNNNNQFTLTATGSTVEAYNLIDSGDGFSPLTTPNVISKSNGETDFPNVTSYEVVNGRISNFTIDKGGENYVNDESITITKANATSAVLTVTSLKNGLISEVLISDGGANYSSNDEIDVVSANGTGGKIQLTNIDDGHLDTVEIVDPGSGYVNGNNTIKNISEASNNETIRIQTTNDHGDPNESILCILENLDESLRGY